MYYSEPLYLSINLTGTGTQAILGKGHVQLSGHLKVLVTKSPIPFRTVLLLKRAVIPLTIYLVIFGLMVKKCG